MTSHVDPIADTDFAGESTPDGHVPSRRGADVVLVRLEKKVDDLATVIHGNGKMRGHAELLRQLDDKVSTLTKRTPHPAAIWILVSCAGIVALQALVSLVGAR